MFAEGKIGISLKPGMLVEHYFSTETNHGQYVLLVDSRHGYVLTGRDADSGSRFPDATVELGGYTEVNPDDDSIICVYDGTGNIMDLHNLVVHADPSMMTVLWERSVKMTRKELRERLGFNVEIVD